MINKTIKYLPALIIAIFAILALIGYTQEESGSPVRVLFKTQGGAVIFGHQTHASDYGIECVKCHHKNDLTGENKYDCRFCHRSGTDYDKLCDSRPIHKQCIGANCIDCHNESGMDTKDCKSCHR